MPFILNVTTVEKLHLQGECQTIDTTTFEIPLPQLPGHGAWSVSGTVLAFNASVAGPPSINDSLAFLLRIAGNVEGGQVMRSDGLATPYTTLPATGGLPVAISVSILNQTLFLSFNGIEEATIIWGWDIDLEFVRKPI